MISKMVLTLSFFFTSLFAANFFDRPSHFYEINKSKINYEMQSILSQHLKNSDLKIHNHQTRDDDDLYGSWIAIDMLIYEDISFTNGSSVIDSADFEELVFTFYDDNTLDIWFNYGDYEEIEYFDWYTENDSIYSTDMVGQNLESAWYELTEDNQLIIQRWPNSKS